MSQESYIKKTNFDGDIKGVLSQRTHLENYSLIFLPFVICVNRLSLSCTILVALSIMVYYYLNDVFPS